MINCILHVPLSLSLQYFNLHLSQFGPYRLDYSRTGRYVLKNYIFIKTDNCSYSILQIYHHFNIIEDI